MKRKQDENFKKGEGKYTHSLNKFSELPNPVVDGGDVMVNKDFALTDVS